MTVRLDLADSHRSFFYCMLYSHHQFR
ncbi:Protein of unknown function [Leuconostoc citreum LBAE C10]|nr:Protein of unknown function [Leuconostoc citreum LBAE C10]